ncbi:MAG TPA: DUF4159 domain-containing protein [Thermoanaerobaculia bacterium]|nr:DUF4159 domain-containing protein [Thermoanaerobaculia bacterium]
MALALAQPPRRRSDRRLPSPRGVTPFALPPMPVDSPIDPRPPLTRPDGAPYEFYFTRAAYSGHSMQGFASWTVDYPKADRQFMIGVRRLVEHLDAYEYENPILLTDPELQRYPFLYAVEPGHMLLSEAEVEGLRHYLLSGGFLVLDDFWGSWEWRNVESELERVLPGMPIVDLDLDHPIFHAFYDVEQVIQVPNVGNGTRGDPTWEQDGYHAYVRGISDDDGQLLVVINANTDLGDAWEWAEDPYYPLEFSTYAYKMGVNFIVYAMTH